MIEINVAYDESGSCTVMYEVSGSLYESRLIKRTYDLYLRAQARRFNTCWVPPRRVSREYRQWLEELKDQDFPFSPEL